jgi:glycosyltransferase involved in cell wall biosynthesis
VGGQRSKLSRVRSEMAVRVSNKLLVHEEGLMFEVSVIICTHNPRKKYLERTLCALRAQTLPQEHWELLLVDNASSEPLGASWDISWHSHAKHVAEAELGLASARRCGIKASTGDLLIFVDDDNVLASDYLAEALRIAKGCWFLGAWGSGSIAPEFEVEPASHLGPLIPGLALRNIERAVWANTISCDQATPVGAGLCVKREVASAYIEYCATSSIHISDRKGSALGGHGDFEICYMACQNGLGMGLFPELKIVHLIPKERVSNEYFLKLVEGTHLTGNLLAYKWSGSVPRSPLSLRGLASVAKNVLMRRGFARQIYLAGLRGQIEARHFIMNLGQGGN